MEKIYTPGGSLLLSAIFILFAVPVQYRFLSFIPVFLFWIVYYILLYREKKKKDNITLGALQMQRPFLMDLHIMIEKHSW